MWGLFKPVGGAVGLELDTGGIRVVELRGTQDTYKIIRWEHTSLPAGAVVEGVVVDVDAVAGALQELWHKAGIGSRQVVLGIFNQGVLMRLVNFPVVPKNQLARALWFHAGEYFPIPLDQLVLDYAVVGETNGERGAELEILLVAAQRELLAQSLQALTIAGLKPVIVDSSLLALMQVLPKDDNYPDVALLYISKGWGGLLVVSEGVPRFARLISQCLQPDPNQDAKKDINPVPNPDHNRLQNFSMGKGGSKAWLAREVAAGNAVGAGLPNWAPALVDEICSSLRYYSAQPGAGSVKAIYVSGQGARVAELTDLLQVALGLPVVKINPLENRLDVAPGRIYNNQDSLDFALSTGLALRGLGA